MRLSFILVRLLVAVLVLSFIGSTARCENLALETLRGTVRISKGTVSATGFVVALDKRPDGEAPRHILITAAHVFDEIKGIDCKVVMRTVAADGKFTRREVTVALRSGEKRLWTRHTDMDVALIAFDPPAGVDLKPFAYRRVADAKWAADGKVAVGQDVLIPCFPAQLEANPAGWPVLRKGSIATHPLSPLSAAKTMMIDYSNFGGDSGAPVVITSADGPVVVGLVSGMQRQTVRVTTPFEDRTTHTPLGLAIVVQSPFIRETVELWLKK